MASRCISVHQCGLCAVRFDDGRFSRLAAVGVVGIIRRRREAVLQATAAAEVVSVDTRIVGYDLPDQKDEVHD